MHDENNLINEDNTRSRSKLILVIVVLAALAVGVWQGFFNDEASGPSGKSPEDIAWIQECYEAGDPRCAPQHDEGVIVVEGDLCNDYPDHYVCDGGGDRYNPNIGFVGSIELEDGTIVYNEVGLGTSNPQPEPELPNQKTGRPMWHLVLAVAIAVICGYCAGLIYDNYRKSKT